jgi:large subunit ribosomal protein L24
MSKKQTVKVKVHVKIGDTVTVISGFNKNETGEVIKINKKTGKLLVKGINFKFKHVKPNTENEIGEIKQFEAPIHHSNVKLNLKEVS